MIWGEEMLVYWPWSSDWQWCDEQEFDTDTTHACHWLTNECMFALDDSEICGADVEDVLSYYFDTCIDGDGHEVPDCGEYMTEYGL